MYKLNCKDCSEFYIGMTCRRLEQRIGEHSTSVSSAVLQHISGADNSNNSSNLDTSMKLGKNIPYVILFQNQS